MQIVYAEYDTRSFTFRGFCPLIELTEEQAIKRLEVAFASAWRTHCTTTGASRNYFTVDDINFMVMKSTDPEHGEDNIYTDWC